jgi:hypothetical protein
MILRRGIANYFKRNLKESLRSLNYSIDKNYLLGDAYLYRAFCFLDLDLKKRGCEDLKKAEFFGNKDAPEYIIKYCDSLK